MGITVTLRGGSGDMLMSTYDPDLDGVIAVAETEADMKKSVYDVAADGKIDYLNQETQNYIASDNLLKAHDAQVDINNSNYVAASKTITISTDKVVGIIRVKFTLWHDGAAGTTYGKIMVDGVTLKGAEQSQLGTSKSEKTQDIDFGSLPVGSTIELWLKDDAVGSGHAENFRIYGKRDTGTDPVFTNS